MRIKYKGETGTLLSCEQGTCQLIMDSGEVVFTEMENVHELRINDDLNGQMCELMCGDFYE